jgi:acetyltransferase-like isoleucine patch superfamily enzyme
MIANSAKIYNDVIYQDDTLTVKDYSIIYEDVELGKNINIGEHVIIGRAPKATKAMVRKLENKLKTIIEDDVSISAGVIIYEGVSIGKDTLIGDHSSIFSNVNIGSGVLISRNVTINGEVTIGNNTRIMDNSHITGRVNIGDNVFISVGVSMANDNLFGKNGYSDDVNGATIGNFVSIGVGSILMPNINIGNGSIIAAGSLVKEDVPENVIVAGNPARIITRVPKYMKRN